MANRRSFPWFLSILIAGGGIAAQPAAAKPRDLSLYPLRVHIFQSELKRNPYYGGFVEGAGRANLTDGHEIHGIDFAYSCPVNYMKSLGDQAYAAKWNKPGKTLEVVGNSVGNEKQQDICVFKVTLHDYVYDMQYGILATFTEEEYKVRIGAALPAAGAVDSDISHYPIRLSILAINWGPPVNGRRAGTGRGNVATSAGLSSVDFTADCSFPIRSTGQGRFLPGRWVNEGSVLALLLKAGGESGGSSLCTLKTSLHTDIYVLDASGAVKAVSPEEYRRSILKTTAAAEPGVQDAGKHAGEPASGEQADLKTPGSAAVETPPGNGTGGIAVQQPGNPNVVDVQTNVAATNSGLPKPSKTETTVVVNEPGIGGVASTTPASAQAAALYRKACDGGSPFGCRNLALAYAVGNGVSQSYAQAATLYRKACNGGDAGSCSNLGLLYANGTGVAQDYNESVALYRKGCDAGDRVGCSNLGLMYSQGTGVSKDYAQAVALYRRACDAGLTASCSNLGLMYANGTGVPRDYTEAVTLYRKGCDEGNIVSCGNLGEMFANGTGVPQDYTQAVTLIRKSCDAGIVVSCSNLGLLYANGSGVPRDNSQAVALYRKACDAGNLAGCVNLAGMYEHGAAVPQDYTQAATLYRKGCDAGLAESCVNLGILYENGTGLSRDHAQAMSLFRKACDGGIALGCNNLGVMYQKEADSAGPPH